MADTPKKGKESFIALMGCCICLAGSFFMGAGMDVLGWITILIGIPVAVIGIVQNLKKK